MATLSFTNVFCAQDDLPSFTVTESWAYSWVVVLKRCLQDAGKDSTHREMYDIAVARAVAEMRILGKLRIQKPHFQIVLVLNTHAL